MAIGVNGTDKMFSSKGQAPGGNYRDIEEERRD